MPIVPATQKAEVRRSLKPRNSRLDWATQCEWTQGLQSIRQVLYYRATSTVLFITRQSPSCPGWSQICKSSCLSLRSIGDYRHAPLGLTSFNFMVIFVIWKFSIFMWLTISIHLCHSWFLGFKSWEEYYLPWHPPQKKKSQSVPTFWVDSSPCKLETHPCSDVKSSHVAWHFRALCSDSQICFVSVHPLLSPSLPPSLSIFW